MTVLGYALLAEEHNAPTLVRNAQMAEAAGFDFAAVSDHFHPWLDSQGESPFVWSVLGAIAQATDRIVLGTAVTCPTVRMHPAIVAQAAATMGTLAPGRFFLGVGSGENLNEHVLGDHWPPVDVRLEMLEEAIHIIHQLFEGSEWSFNGDYYNVEYARLYSVPEEQPRVLVAASGSGSAGVAARAGDGLITLAPDAELLQQWRSDGGSGPTMGMIHLVHAESIERGREILAKHWSHAPLPSHMSANLRRPAEFEAASMYIRLEDYDDSKTPMGPDPEPLLGQIRAYEEAGYDHVLLHQVGPEQEAFLRFFEQEIAPHISDGAGESLTPAA